MTKFAKLTSMFIAVAVVGSGVFLATKRTTSSSYSQKTSTHTPINLAIDALSADYSKVPAICTTTLVADFTLLKEQSAHWNTANGQYPDGLNEMQVENGGYRIVTPLVFKTLTSLVDHRKNATKEYVVVGGAVGLDSMSLDDAPNLKSAQRYIGIFLPEYDTQAKTYTENTLSLVQAFPIQDGQVILKNKTVEQGQVTQDQVAESIADYRSELSSCK